MSFYPNEVHKRLVGARCAGRAIDENASGRSASLLCGCFAAFSLSVDKDQRIVEARFQTNGCGFMIAAGDAIAERLQEKYLTELHGLATAELMQITDAELGRFPRDRIQCAGVVFEALRDALARYRSRLVEEFTGEKALICTCFGVSEDTLVAVIAANRLTDVDDVASFCRAGSGCGSCRMLIAEFIDAQSR